MSVALVTCHFLVQRADFLFNTSDITKNLFLIFNRGVIQLFNAVKKHQNEMGEKLKSAKTEQKKEKLYKNLDRGKFLRMLRGDEKSNPTDDDKTVNIFINFFTFSTSNINFCLLWPGNSKSCF